MNKLVAICPRANQPLAPPRRNVRTRRRDRQCCLRRQHPSQSDGGANHPTERDCLVPHREGASDACPLLSRAIAHVPNGSPFCLQSGGTSVAETLCSARLRDNQGRLPRCYRYVFSHCFFLHHLDLFPWADAYLPRQAQCREQHIRHRHWKSPATDRWDELPLTVVEFHSYNTYRRA